MRAWNYHRFITYLLGPGTLSKLLVQPSRTMNRYLPYRIRLRPVVFADLNKVEPASGSDHVD